MQTQIQIEPFADCSACNKCGAADARIQFDPQDGPVAIAPMSPYSVSVINTRYCAGGKEPEEKSPVSGIGSVLGHLLEGRLPEGMNLGELGKRTINICAGVMQEHLHKTCSRCGFEFLTETREKFLESVKAHQA